MTRLRVDHTGLNSTLFLVGKNNNNCGVKENFEDVIFDRVLYEVERRVWQNRVQEVESDGNIRVRRKARGDKDHQESNI